MATPNEFQTLAKVTTEIGESEVKLTYANQCIKAQEDLFNKLKAEIERRREVCHFQKNGNLKLQAEVQNAEHEIRNLITTHDAITSANTEMKKELLLAKENNERLLERMRKAEKKYDNLWIESKKRYESIPIVKKCIKNSEKIDALQVDITVLENEKNMLDTEIKIKKGECADKDRKQIIQLAQFLVHEMPAAINVIKEKTKKVEELTKEIDSIIKEQEVNRNKILSGTMAKLNIQNSDDTKVENWANINNNNDDTLMMPRLQLPSFNLDMKLDINKVAFQTAPVKRTISTPEIEKNPIKQKKDETLANDYISCYFNKTTEDDDEKQMKNSEDFSKKKLINILEDVKLDEQETYKIISKVNPDKLQDISIITGDNTRENSPPTKARITTQSDKEDIEEIDLTTQNTNEDNVIIPPTQFLDIGQANFIGGYQQEVKVDVHVPMEQQSSKKDNLTQEKTSQDGNAKKKVSFDIPMDVDEQIQEKEVTQESKMNQSNDSIVSQLDMSIGGDDNFSSIKDMILKKHNLDLSPQFVYGKNVLLQKKLEGKIVTSKFFENNAMETDEVVTANKDAELDKNIPETNENTQTKAYESIPEEEHLETVDVSSLKAVDDKPVEGILFTHGPQGIPDCLDISMSTTGYDEGDSDFPTCLDSSLLLSPKADVSANVNNNIEVGSQEVPNFLSGFRKAGLSFFKQTTSSDNNPDTGKHNPDNNFSFNFGEEKKNRGGIFSFFQ